MSSRELLLEEESGNMEIWEASNLSIIKNNICNIYYQSHIPQGKSRMSVLFKNYVRITEDENSMTDREEC